MMASGGDEYKEDLQNLCNLLSFKQILPFPVNKLECAAGSSSGDNYMSIVKRVRLSNSEHDRQNATTQELTLIIKRQIASLSRRQLYRCDEAFCNEINAYKHMVPLLRQYTVGSIFPQCYVAGKDDSGEIIVLEDLQRLGYRMQSRLAGLELSYCQLVMKHLAKLHAASIAAKQVNGAMFKEKCKQIKDIVYGKEAEEFYKNLLDGSVRESLCSLRASNKDGSLTEPIRMIESLQADLYCEIQKGIVNSPESMNVMCHGDLWVNNILFTSADTQPDKLPDDVRVRFIDLQAMRYTSPIFDILHFIYTSTKRELRESCTKALLETYSLALFANLEPQLEHAHAQLSQLRDIYSLHNITAEYYKNVLYGLAVSIWVLPAVTFDPNNIPNLDAISEMNTSAKEIDCSQKLTAEYHTRVKDLALEFYQNGYLKSYLREHQS